jgi:hypothetical protein
MDPSNKSASGIEVPLPPMESAPPAANSGEIIPLGPGPERPPANVERAPVPGLSTAPPSTIPLPVPQPVSVTTTVSAAGGTVTSQSTPLAAKDDGDLIEKVWVDKAKQIVGRTKNDPHKQSEELTIFRADYMKKRYGKTIKISQ